MKIKKIKYKPTNYFSLDNKTEIKQSLKIIYEYHLNNKTILFLGFPELKHKKYKTLLNQTKHYFLSDQIWKNGVISNNRFFKDYLTKKLNDNDANNKKLNDNDANNKKLNDDDANNKKSTLKNFETIIKLRETPNLLVIFKSKKTSTVLSEFFKLNIPIIIFEDDYLNTLNRENDFTYKITFNINKTRIKYIYIYLIYAIFKRKLKKKKSYIPKIYLNTRMGKKKILRYQKLKYGYNKNMYQKKYKPNFYKNYFK